MKARNHCPITSNVLLNICFLAITIGWLRQVNKKIQCINRCECEGTTMRYIHILYTGCFFLFFFKFLFKEWQKGLGDAWNEKWIPACSCNKYVQNFIKSIYNNRRYYGIFGNFFLYLLRRKKNCTWQWYHPVFFITYFYNIVKKMHFKTLVSYWYQVLPQQGKTVSRDSKSINKWWNKRKLKTIFKNHPI